MRDNIWQARTMFLQNVRTWPRHPKHYRHFNNKHCGKLKNVWSITCCAFKFCNIYSGVFVKEGQSFFPDSQDFHYDCVPYLQGTSCKVIFGPRNKTVSISLYMANFVLCIFQVPEIKSSKERVSFRILGQCGGFSCGPLET